MSFLDFFKNKESSFQQPEPINNSSARDLSGILNSVGVGLIIIDENDCLLELNESSMGYLGLSENTIGSKAVEVLKSVDLINLIKQVKETTNQVEEISGTHAGDKNFLVSATYDEDNQETQIVMMDTTRSNRLENVRRDFITNLSHELRTPVSVIRANSESLIDGALEDEGTAKKFSTAILRNAEKLTRLLSDILNLSTLESGEYTLDIRSTNVTPIISNVVSNLKEANPTVDIQVTINEDLMVMCDIQAFEQVMSNLIENGIKYGTTDNSNTLSISAKPVGQKMRFEIEDKGQGILPEERKRVFERFYRVDKGRSRSQGGTGLGLAIVKHIIEAHEQKINISSQVNKGTAISFTLKNSIK